MFGNSADTYSSVQPISYQGSDKMALYGVSYRDEVESYSLFLYDNQMSVEWAIEENNVFREDNGYQGMISVLLTGRQFYS